MMKRTLLLAFALASTASARTLIDTRIPTRNSDFPAATQQKVIGDLMRWPTDKVCADANLYDVATGSFTKKGVKETVYIVQDCVKSDGPAGVHGSYWRMALYRDGKLQQVLANAGTNIGNVGDINGDGVDDLVFLGYKQDKSAAILDKGATFFTLAGGKFRRVLDLDEAFAEDCSSGPISYGNIRAYRVSIGAPSMRPTFTIEQFKNKGENCDATTPNDYTLLKKWTLRGK